jgi:hypothetical protein
MKTNSKYNTKPPHCINFVLYAVAPSPNSSTDAKAWGCVVGLRSLCIGADLEDFINLVFPVQKSKQLCQLKRYSSLSLLWSRLSQPFGQ